MSGDDKPEDEDDKTVFMPPERKGGDEEETPGDGPDEGSATSEEDDDEKTVFMPPKRTGANAAENDDPPSDEVEEEDDEKTVFVPRQSFDAADGNSESEAPPPEDPEPEPSAASAPLGSDPDFGSSAPPPDPSAFPAGPSTGTAPIQPIKVGDFVNVFRIERFIAKGGMGEVYEAVNPHPPFESVAVKLMLPDLANDKNALEMFYKEASALGRVHHGSIVQYRIASQSPNGQPYLITEFVPGPSLQELLGKITLDEAQVRDLTKRLSRGLGAAHKEDVVHRDIAPDNVLLVEGNPERPKIIDFGIVKDTQENGKTIIGDGFAGKLRYVAPEQLGEYDFNVGPWTDIYSLALTMLAVATGAHADMGSSLSDAVRKRISVPDLSAIPEGLRPAFEAALQPDPADRPQTMGAFAELLDGGALTPAPTGPATGGEPIAATPDNRSEGNKDKGKGPLIGGVLGEGEQSKKWLVYGGVGAFVLLAALVGILVLATSPDEVEDPSDDGTSEAPIAQEATRRPIEQVAQQAIGQAQCAWLTYEGSEGNTARFSGGAARPGAVIRDMQNTFGSGGYHDITLDTSDVVEFGQNLCPLVDALQGVRREAPVMSSPRASYELEMQASRARGGTDANIAKPVLNVSGLNPADDAILLYIEDETAAVYLPNKDNIATVVNGLDGQISETGFQVALEYDSTGNNALILLTGSSSLSGFPASLIPRDGDLRPISVTQDWARQFEQQARDAGWKADILWFRVVDEK